MAWGRGRRTPCSPGARQMASAGTYPAFTGGTAVGQWRPDTSGDAGASARRHSPSRRRSFSSATRSSGRGRHAGWRAAPTPDFDTVKALGGETSARHATIDQTSARAVLGGQCERPLEPGRQSARARPPPVHVRVQPAARGCSTSRWPIRHSRSGVPSATTVRSGRGHVAACDRRSRWRRDTNPGHMPRRRPGSRSSSRPATRRPRGHPSAERCGRDGASPPLRGTRSRSR